MLSPTTLLLTVGAGLVIGSCGWKSAPNVNVEGAGGAGNTGAGGAVIIDAGGADVAAGEAGDGAPGDATPGDLAPPYFTSSYHMGADITWVQHDEYYGATYLDTDGTAKDILVIMKNHGFNSVRMRTFVDPKAYDGYDQFGGFGDKTHTVAMARRLKEAQMGFYLAIHYSDNWADPGKQCVPMSWQGLTSIDAMAKAVHDYTFDLISALQAEGATPQFVQVGNEITSGMLIHVCDAAGTPTATNPINGAISSWPNLGTLLKAGVAAVKEVDPRIKVVLHIDKARDAGASVAFVNGALAQHVPFDVFADSAYVYWHGQPSGWQNTFNTLVTTFPNLSFVIPEYGNETATDPPLTSTMRFVNDLIFNIPGNRGLGTWIYEPEHPFQAGPFAGMSLGIGLFDGVHGDGGVVTGDSWPVFPALPAAMSDYDQMKTAYSSRL